MTSFVALETATALRKLGYKSVRVLGVVNVLWSSVSPKPLVKVSLYPELGIIVIEN